MPNGQQRQVQVVTTESVWAKQLPSNQNWILWTCFCWRYKLIQNSPKIHLFLLKTTFTFAYIGTPGPERGLSIVLRYLWFSKSLYRICCKLQEVSGSVGKWLLFYWWCYWCCYIVFFRSFGLSFRDQWKADPLAIVMLVALRWLLSTASDRKL